MTKLALMLSADQLIMIKKVDAEYKAHIAKHSIPNNKCTNGSDNAIWISAKLLKEIHGSLKTDNVVTDNNADVLAEAAETLIDELPQSCPFCGVNYLHTKSNFWHEDYCKFGKLELEVDKFRRSQTKEQSELAWHALQQKRMK